MTRSDYWKNRDELEKEANQKYINQDSAYLKELEAHYNLMLDNINKQIDAEYSSLANRNHVSIDLAMQQVSQMDVSIYSTKAKQIVEEAAKIKNKVSYSDYPDAVNQELRVYNATMRINRLELLKANVGLEIQNVGLEIYNEASNRLAQRYKAESKRQAGILGLNEPADRLYASPDMRNVINATVKGATWSQRLWANQQGLRYAVNQLLTTGATNSNRQKLKELLQTTVNNWRYVTQRLINTELARVQYKAQKDSITKADYKYVKWIAEPKACSTCNRIARTDNGWGKGVWELEKVPDIPQDTHPNCRCAISAHWVSENKEEARTTDQSPLTSEEMEKIIGFDKVAALKQYMSSESYLLNDCLRNDVKLNDNQQKLVDNLDSALAKLPKYKSDKPLNRDFLRSFQLMDIEDAFEIVKKWRREGGYQDKAYISTSKGHYGEDEELIHMIIKKYHSGVDLSSIDKKLYISDKEQEVLFSRNTKFNIISVEEDKVHKKLIVIAEEADE
ncbi:hypothetical protein L2422_06650 [Lactobacillus mulieris]|uniref:Phage head morphogenesis protein n=4 Tax=Lactobacillus TaxID=1578 RepID=A0AAP3GXN8_9LACO|nr:MULTISPECIES: ADP-ribosyltransferase [Lactobacillus]MCZ3845172.1 hypothetical protein [Lactobacillus mulieris]MCZ3900388.1 hypothetical protein [Lactobacillus mulieris]MCZ9641342.1 hypothetical protein [Lactobacillus jensenii]